MDCLEMGGYLPLELNEGISRFHGVPHEDILAVNTGRTAIWCAIKNLTGKRIHVPIYYCPDVISMLQTLGIEIMFYHIDYNLLPKDLVAESEDIVLLVNYYGIVNGAVSEYAEKFPKVIIDQSHGYFYEPVLRHGVMNVYSCRKFIGVPDGAYLVGKNLKEIRMDQDISYERLHPLYKSIELGTNAGYRENKDNEHFFENSHLKMSELTRKILDNADNERIINRRCENFSFLHEKLGGVQKLAITETNIVPYMYPLLLEKDIHDILVQKKIYAPVLWSHLLGKEWEGTLEQQYAKYMIPLPVDQRYSLDEMTYMVDTIYSVM